MKMPCEKVDKKSLGAGAYHDADIHFKILNGAQTQESLLYRIRKGEITILKDISSVKKLAVELSMQQGIYENILNGGKPALHEAITSSKIHITGNFILYIRYLPFIYSRLCGL